MAIIRDGSAECCPAIIGVGFSAFYWTPAPHSLGSEGNKYEGVFFDIVRLVNRFRTSTSEGVVSVRWDEIVRWNSSHRTILRIGMSDQTSLEFTGPAQQMQQIGEFASHQLSLGSSGLFQ